MQILNCDRLINSCCNDYTLARSLYIFNNIIDLIHILIPIILILMITVNIYQLMSNPEEEKLKKKLLNKVIATVIIFLMPTFVNVVLSIIPNSYDLYGCLQESKHLKMTGPNEITYKEIDEEKKNKVINNPDDYEKGQKSNNNQQNIPSNDNTSSNNNNNSNNNNSSNSRNNNSSSNSNNNNSSNNNSNSNNNSSNNSNSNKNETSNSSGRGKGNILLIAGHSYSPYCQKYSDCRGKSPASGYAEEDETRKLVKLIKANLDSMNVKNDIANALLAGDYNQMNKSFFIESRSNSKLFNKFDWDKYTFVLEVHFNATSRSNASGTLLCKKSSSYKTKADDDIVKAVISHTGKTHLKDSIQSLNNVSYFTKRNIPIVYLETEFYDNASAMKTYTNHINEIAYDIAAAIKKHYG